MSVVNLTMLLGAMGTLIATLFGLWKQTRELAENKEAQQANNEKAKQEQQASLNQQLQEALKSERDEQARRRQEDRDTLQRVITKLDDCESHRLKDAEDRALMRAELAYLKGKVEGLPLVPLQAMPAKTDAAG